jgi:hypothetical protein
MYDSNKIEKILSNIFFWMKPLILVILSILLTVMITPNIHIGFRIASLYLTVCICIFMWIYRK